MLNVGKIEEGFVLDHIEAGKSLDIYHHLKLDKLDCTVAIIKNARSNKMGKKDILKVECDINTLDLDILAFIDHNITVNVIKDGDIVDKKILVLPREIHNVIKCRNPRCITSIEQGLPHIFVLAEEEKEIYRCKYCEGRQLLCLVSSPPFSDSAYARQKRRPVKQRDVFLYTLFVYT